MGQFAFVGIPLRKVFPYCFS